MLKLILAAIFTMLSAPAFAGPALDSLAAAAGGAQELRGPVRVQAVKEPVSVKLNWEIDQSYKPASSEFAWGDKRYSLKLLFSRGVYDPYVKNFKAQPRLRLESSEGSIWPYSPFEASFDDDFMLEGGVRDHINVFRQGNTLTVSGCDEKSNCKELASVPVRALYTDWQNRPGSVVLKVENKTFFAVPQATWWDHWSYGYVLSENSVTQLTTGMPQDYVELFRDGADGLQDFRPKVYSLALGLAFELRVEDGAVIAWDVRPMLESELQEATNDALGNRSVLRPVSGPAAAALKAVK